MRQARPSRPDQLHLEPLEPRLLLSAESLLADPGMLARTLDDGAAMRKVMTEVMDNQPVAMVDPLAPTVEALTISTEAEACDALVEGLDDLRAALPTLAAGFDLTGTSLPVLPNALNQLFGLSTAATEQGNALLPTITTASTLTGLVDALQASGYEVLSVQGGMSDRGIAASSDGVLIEARWAPSTGVALSPSASYAGATFDNSTDGLLTGLSSGSAVDADWGAQLGADLRCNVTFGVDASGFFVRAGTMKLIAELRGQADLGGAADLAGTSGVSLEGQASVDVAVDLQLQTATELLRIGEVATSAGTDGLAEDWSGQAGLQLDFTLGSSELTFQAGYQAASGQPAENPTFTLTGEIHFPGVVDDNGADATLAVNGVFDVAQTRWTLTATTAEGQTLHFHGLELKDFTLNLAIDPSSYSGSTSGDLVFDFLRTDSGPVSCDFTANLTQAGFSLETVVNLGTVALREGSDLSSTLLLDLTGTVVTFNASGTYASDGYTAKLGFVATGADLTPGQRFQAKVTTNAEAPATAALSGNFDLLAGVFDFDLAQVTVEDAGVFLLTATAVGFHYDRNSRERSALVSMANGRLQLTAFDNDPELTLQQASIYADGFFIEQGEATVSGIELGSFLSAGATTITFDNVGYTLGENPTGSIHVEVADHVSLLQNNSTVTCVLLDGADDGNVALAGDFSIAALNFSLTGDHLTFEVKDTLRVEADGMTLSYDPNVAGEQDLFTVAAGAVTILPLHVNGQPLEATAQGLRVTTEGLYLNDLVLPAVGESLGTISLHNGREGDAQRTLFSLDDLRLELSNIALTLSDGLSGTLQLSAGTVGLLPDVESLNCTVSDSDGDGVALSGAITLSGDTVSDFAVTVDQADIEIAGTFKLQLVNAVFDPYADVLFSEATLTVDVEKLGVTGTITGLAVRHDGTISAIGVALDISQVKKLPLGGVLPFRIDALEVTFLGDTNGNGVQDPGETFSLADFEFAVTGRFDFAQLTESLPFSPYILLGDPAAGGSQHADGADSDVTFGLRSVDGALTPWELPSLTLGIQDFNIGSLATFAGEITLGGYAEGAWTGEVGGFLVLKQNDKLKNLQSADTEGGSLMAEEPGDLRITIDNNSTLDLTSGVLDISAEFGVSFDLGDYLAVTGLEAAFSLVIKYDLENLSFKVPTFGLQGASFEQATMTFKNWLTIECSTGSINFAAKDGENWASFSSLTVAMGAVGLSGEIDALAFDHAGLPVAEPGFGIHLTANDTFLEKVGWADWLPIDPQNLDIKVSWADFNANPHDFTVEASGAVTAKLPGTELAMAGELDGLKFAVDDNGLHIESLTEVKLDIDWVLGGESGADVEGHINLGLLRLDASGNVIAATDTDTAVDQRVLYGLVDATIAFGGFGFSFRLGLCDFGPISAYVMAEGEIPIGGETGLSIQKLFAEINFGAAPLASITDPKDLNSQKNVAIKPADEQTAAQWEQACLTSIATIAAEGGDALAKFEDLLTHFTVQGGITINDVATKDMVELTGNVVIDTSGRMLVRGIMTLTEYGRIDATVFLDLSQLKLAGDQAASSGSLMVYGDLESTVLSAPPVSVYGDFKVIGTSDTQDYVSLQFDGGLVFSLDGAVNVEIDGTATFRPESAKRYVLEVSGETSLTGFPDLFGLDGDLIVDVADDGDLQIYGALVARPGEIKQLESLGLQLDGLALWRFNFTQSAKQVELTVPGRDAATYDLAAASVSTLLEGVVRLKEAGSDWLSFHGSVSLYETEDTIDMIIDAEAVIGPTGSSDEAWLTFTALGYLRLDLYGIAGEIELDLKDGGELRDLIGEDLSVDASFTLRLNTTGETIHYTIPTEFGLAAGGDTIDLPAEAPEILGGESSGTAAAWVYLAIEDRSLKLHDTATISGDFALVGSSDGLEVRLDNGVVKLGPDASLATLHASGSLKVDASGAVGALTVDLSSDGLASGALHLSGTAQWLINTTGVEVTLVDGTVVPAGIEGDPFSQLVVDGDLVLDEPKAGFLTLNGHHVFEVVAAVEGPGYHLRLSTDSVLRMEAGGTLLFAATFSGGGYVDDTGLAAFLAIKPESLNNPGGFVSGFDLSTMTLGLNTTASNLAVTKSGDEVVFTAVSGSTSAGALAVLPSKVGAQLSAGGFLTVVDAFRIGGDFTFTLDDNVWSLALDGSLQLVTPPGLVGEGEESVVLLAVPLQHTFTLHLPGLQFADTLDLSLADLSALGISGGESLSVVLNSTKESFAGHDGPYAALELNGIALDMAGFDFSGDLHFEADALSSLSASGDFDISLGVAGATIFSAAASGDFHVGFDGLAGRLEIAQPTLTGFEFQTGDEAGTEFFQIDFNTSSKAFTFTNGDETLTLAAHHAIVHINTAVNPLGMDAIVLRGRFDLEANGDLTVLAELDTYLVSQEIDGTPLFSIGVEGSLTHSATGTSGQLRLQESSGQAGLDLPASWGISLGKENEELWVEFNLVHGGEAAASASDQSAGGDVTTAPSDSIRIVAKSRLVLGAQQINGTFYLTWVRGQDFVIAVDGSTYFGFGEINEEGKPADVLLGVDIGGILDVTDHGVFGGFEVEFEAGATDPAVLEKLGLNFGLGAEDKLYVMFNTTGEAQSLPDLPSDLNHFDADVKFAAYLDTALKISSMEFDGMLEFTLYDDGVRIGVDVVQNLSLFETSDASSGDASTAFTLAKTVVAGFLQVRSDGVIGFLDAQLRILDLSIEGFTLFNDEFSAVLRVNTTGKAVDMSALMPDLKTVLPASFLAMPAGHYAQLIFEAAWTTPPFVGLHFEDWIALEIVDNAFVISGQVSIKAELSNSVGIEMDLFSAKADIAAVITKDRSFALAGVLDENPLGSIHSGFFATDLSADQQVGIQIKTFDAAMNLADYLPSSLLSGVASFANFDAGAYAKLYSKAKIDAVQMGVGVTMEGDMVIEFKSEGERVWLEAVMSTDVEAKFSILGTTVVKTDVGVYIGSDGLAVLVDRTASKSGISARADFDFTADDFEFSFNTTGHSIALGQGTVSAEALHMVLGGSLQVAPFTLVGDYVFNVGAHDVKVTSELECEVLGVTLEKVASELSLSEAGLVAKVTLGERKIDLGALFAVSGNMVMEINTTSKRDESTGVAAQTVQLAIDGAALTVAGVTAKGDLWVTANAEGEARIEIPASAPLVAEITGISEFKLSGWLSNSSYALNGSETVTLGVVGVAEFTGSVAVKLAEGANFEGTLTGDLKVLGHEVINHFSESVSLHGIDVPFSFSERIALPGAMSFVQISGAVQGRITNAGIKLNDNTQVTVKVHHFTPGKVGFVLDTAHSGGAFWRLSGTTNWSTHVSEINGTLHLSFIFSVDNRGADWVHLSVNGSGHRWGVSASGSGGGDITQNSAKIEVGLRFSALGLHKTVTIKVDLKSSSVIKASDLGGSQIFLDTNGNGLLDDGEVWTMADADGTFHFNDPDSDNPLGLLAPFDLDGSGVIETDEGMFVVLGGTDQNSGLLNTLNYTFSAESYGRPLAGVYSPLLQVHSDLVANEGLTSEEAWEKIHVAFGIPAYVPIELFDHNLDESSNPDEGIWRVVEAAYAQVNVFLLNAYKVLGELVPNVSESQLQSLLADQLAHALAGVDTTAFVAALNGDDAEAALTAVNVGAGIMNADTVTTVLEQALTGLTGAAPTDTQDGLIAATAHVIEQQASFVTALAASGIDSMTEVLAMIKQEASNNSSALLVQVAAGEVDANELMASYGINDLVTAVLAGGINLADQPLALGTMNSFTGGRDQLTAVAIPLIDLNSTGDSAVTWQVSSSNSSLLPSGSLQVVQRDGQWFLQVDPAAGVAGTATVTLVATDAEGVSSNTTSWVLNLLPTMSVGAIETTVTPDGASFAMPITLDAVSNQAVTGTYTVSGTAADGVHYAGSTGTFTIAAGELGTTVEIPFLSAPYGSAVSLTVTLTDASHAVIDAEAAAVSTAIDEITPRISPSRALVQGGLTPRVQQGSDARLLGGALRAPTNPDAQQIDPSKLRYRD